MKFLAMLLVLGSTSAFAFTPEFEAKVASDDTITLAISNDTQGSINCSYSMTWFENVITFKKATGTASIDANQVVTVGVKKETSARVGFLKAKVECE